MKLNLRDLPPFDFKDIDRVVDRVLDDRHYDYPEACVFCHRGWATCSYCRGQEAGDVQAICDCGLVDFGVHLISCDLTQAI